jgi:hypothetical protein
MDLRAAVDTFSRNAAARPCRPTPKRPREGDVPMTQKIAPTVTVATELTERCDQCGAAGKLHATFLAGGELTFCGHHANRFAARLMESAAMIMLELGFGWRGAAVGLD